MRVYWLEQTAPDVPDDNEWLTARELVQLNSMRFAKRRAEWQLGRWTAKLAVAACLQLPADLHSLASIEIRPAPSGAPETFLGNQWAPVTISLSHREGKAICAVAPDRGTLGCDLEVIEPHSDAFVADYFTPEEQALVAQGAPADRPWLVTLLWSAKESALKALRDGLRLDTRCVIVTLGDALRTQNEEEEVCVSGEFIKDSAFAARQADSASDWRPLQVRHFHDQTFFGWWQQTGNLLRTVVAAPPPARPCLLNVPHCSTDSPSAVDWDQPQAA